MPTTCQAHAPSSRYAAPPLVDLSVKAERDRLSPSAVKGFLNIMVPPPVGKTMQQKTSLCNKKTPLKGNSCGNNRTVLSTLGISDCLSTEGLRLVLMGMAHDRSAHRSGQESGQRLDHPWPAQAAPPMARQHREIGAPACGKLSLAVWSGHGRLGTDQARGMTSAACRRSFSSLARCAAS